SAWSYPTNRLARRGFPHHARAPLNCWREVGLVPAAGAADQPKLELTYVHHRVPVLAELDQAPALRLRGVAGDSGIGHWITAFPHAGSSSRLGTTTAGPSAALACCIAAP